MIDLKNIQTEVDASFLYKILAENEEDPNVKDVLEQMSAIEYGHAEAFMKSKKIDLSLMPKPSQRAKILKTIGKVFGYDYVLGVVLETEKSLSSSVQAARKANNLGSSLSDTAHVSIVKNILSKSPNITGAGLVRFENHHRSVGGNALRAAVLGGNDGLVSNFSLIMGVAGAMSAQSTVLLAGVSGLLAGALSMALGEWISVKSSQELYENQMELEMEELEHNPEGEKHELALIYQSKGIPKEQAQAMAAEIMKDKTHAHEVLVKEELGINPDDLNGSAMEAAVASFIMFGIGAIIPVIPFFFIGGNEAVLISCVLSAIGLFVIGAAITLFTGKSVWYSGFRQVLFGLAAAAITYGIGSLVGVSLN